MAKEKLHKKLKKAFKAEGQHYHYGEEVFAWIAPQYIKHEKGAKWYLVAGTLVLVSIIWALLHDAWTFALVLTVFCAVYYLNHFEHPHDVKIIISDLGIKVGSRLYPYRNIRAFWIYYLPGHIETLNLLTTDKLFPEISIQLNGQNPVPLRNFLLKQVPEWEGKDETLVEVLLRLLKI